MYDYLSLLFMSDFFVLATGQPIKFPTY